MKLNYPAFLIVIILLNGCSSHFGNAVSPELSGDSLSSSDLAVESLSQGHWGCWGIYDLEIACDGSYVNVIPDRSTSC